MTTTIVVYIYLIQHKAYNYIKFYRISSHILYFDCYFNISTSFTVRYYTHKQKESVVVVIVC